MFVFPWVGLFLIFVLSRFSRHMQPMKTQKNKKTTQWSGAKGIHLPLCQMTLPVFLSYSYLSSLPISAHFHPWVVLYLLLPMASGQWQRAGQFTGLFVSFYYCYQFNHPFSNKCVHLDNCLLSVNWDNYDQREKERTNESKLFLSLCAPMEM